MVCVLSLLAIRSAILSVGPGRAYARIEDAVAAGRSGDTIEVYPRADRYMGTHILLRGKRLAFLGVGSGPVAIAGGSFAYSGQGSIPRAIFQFDPGADGSRVQNFDLSGAHNASGNGAGVRINQAKGVTVSGCNIHGNDTGIMSNGRDGDDHAAENQVIDHCAIHDNGSDRAQGQSHNLYLGGTSATVQFCDIYASRTGHNLKSRAHFTFVRYCYIHDSAERELDLVDGFDTERPSSNAVVLGNVIVKGGRAQNRSVIHFGQEQGRRQGTLFMVNNTFVTPFDAPVLELDSPTSTLALFDNVLYTPVSANAILVAFRRGTGPDLVAANGNWFSKGYPVADWMRANLYTGAFPFRGPADYRLLAEVASLRANPVVYLDGDGASHPAKPAFRYVGNGRWVATLATFLGAG